MTDPSHPQHPACGTPLLVQASLPERAEDMLGDWWQQQVDQYPPSGKPGIEYFRGDTGPGRWVDCLLYRTPQGAIAGILNHFTYDVPELDTYAGHLLVLVKWQMRRRGIATALLHEAIRRWDVDLEHQRCTPSGAALVNAYLARQDPDEPAPPADSEDIPQRLSEEEENTENKPQHTEFNSRNSQAQ